MVRARRTLRGLVLLLGLAGVAYAAPPEEAIMPLEQYKSATARALATTYAVELRQIYDNVYHCLPWLDIREDGLGFRRPRGSQGDGFYLAVWVLVEQIVNPEFTAMPPARRASAMFSRYGIDLLRRLSKYPQLAAEPGLSGYSVVLTWLKPERATERGAQPVNEALAVFVDKATVEGFFRRVLTPTEFVGRAVVASFDGKRELGRLPLELWEDSFTQTFKLKDYTPDPFHRC